MSAAKSKRKIEASTQSNMHKASKLSKTNPLPKSDDSVYGLPFQLLICWTSFKYVLNATTHQQVASASVFVDNPIQSCFVASLSCWGSI